MKNKIQLPAVQKVSQTDLDHHTRQYLQTLVDNKLVVSYYNFFSISDETLENFVVVLLFSMQVLTLLLLFICLLLFRKFSFFPKSLVVTDEVVKIYRNYVILYSLRDVIRQVYTCVTSM